MVPDSDFLGAAVVGQYSPSHSGMPEPVTVMYRVFAAFDISRLVMDRADAGVFKRVESTRACASRLLVRRSSSTTMGDSDGRRGTGPARAARPNEAAGQRDPRATPRKKAARAGRKEDGGGPQSITHQIGYRVLLPYGTLVIRI